LDNLSFGHISDYTFARGNGQMIGIETLRKWSIPAFTVSEGKIVSGSDNCVWCEQVTNILEYVLVVQEDGRTDTSVMHLECLPPEVKAARKVALNLGNVMEDRPNRAPQEAWSSAWFADRRSEQGDASGSSQLLGKVCLVRPMRSTCEMKSQRFVALMHAKKAMVNK
jgi:hypothetical protein